MKASDLFVKCLENEWVEYIFGVPWEENLDLLESLRESDIKLILTRNEQTAVFMAANYWRYTWKVGVALATLWPWATNMVTWVAYAQLWAMPVLVITWQKPIKKSKQWQFQVLDVVSMMKPLTKHALSLPSASRIPTTIRNMFKLALDERPWAVHIEFAEDISAEEVESIEPISPEKTRRPHADDKSFDALVSALEKAKTPIFMVWAWANRKRVTKYLEKFLEKTNIPFFNSQMWKWVVDERMKNYIWTWAVTENDYVHKAVEKADLIITIWHDTVEKPTHLIWEWDTKTVHINFYPASMDDVYIPDLEVVWDIWNIMWRLCEADIKWNWNFDEVYSLAKKWFDAIEGNLSLEDWESKMMPRRLAKELREVLWDEDIITLDNGLYKVWLARNYKAYNPNTIILDNALATMWAWVSAWMAAKMTNLDKKVVTICWDGWFVMNLWDLETAVRLNLDLTILVLNDSAYWMIKWKQKWAWFDDYGLDLWNPDFVKLAESFGATWYLVEDKNDFKSTLEKAVNNKWVNLVEVKFAYPDNID